MIPPSKGTPFQHYRQSVFVEIPPLKNSENDTLPQNTEEQLTPREPHRQASFLSEKQMQEIGDRTSRLVQKFWEKQGTHSQKQI